MYQFLERISTGVQRTMANHGRDRFIGKFRVKIKEGPGYHIL